MEDYKDKIVDLLNNKAAVKQDIADYSEQVITMFKKVMQEQLQTLRMHIEDPRVRLRYEEKGVHEFIAYIGSDVLVFQLHQNVFRLPEGHALLNSKYVEDDPMNAYYGIINIYNFLAESFERNRFMDAGYLIGRVFMNRSEHFMTEGKGQLGFLFNDVENNVITEDQVKQIIQCTIIYSIEFDLITPPYELVQETSVQEIQAVSSDLQVATGKRLGFRFSAESGDFQ